MTDKKSEPGPRKPKFIYTENWQWFMPRIAATTQPLRPAVAPPADDSK